MDSSHFNILVVGGGCAGLTVATRLYNLDRNLKIGVIEPSDVQNYQAAWTLVGAGAYSRAATQRSMDSVFPSYLHRIKAYAQEFNPENNSVKTDAGEYTYDQLVVAPGLKINFAGIEGLEQSLGKNSVCTNYSADMADYTWQSLQQIKSGSRVLFTEPGMPIKCAGAPQKAMYLSADYWQKQGVLKDIQVDFFNTGAVLFGVEAYVPALMEYVKRYNANLHFNHQLVKVDGANKRAWFKVNQGESTSLLETDFDMIHVVPPQQAPDFIRASNLVDAAGWVSVDQNTLQHSKYPYIFALGDVMNAPNAKTAAAARKQAPIVAVNVLQYLKGSDQFAQYDGYGSCPLTVERGKIVLAEFGYGGKLLPSFPKWFLDGQKPSRMAWLLKEQILPPMYWDGMLKGHEWLVKPKL